jgi:hypothetical protein
LQLTKKKKLATTIETDIARVNITTASWCRCEMPECRSISIWQTGPDSL